LFGGLAFAGVLFLHRAPDPPPAPESLPQLGTVLGEFPAGPMKSVADAACLNCHSADMVRQQRLNDKQWLAEVDKMVGWGAVVPEDQKAALVAYLTEHFGPDNEGFQPVVAQPPPR
jgi:quinoprotein glucose dehydrogenase